MKKLISFILCTVLVFASFGSTVYAGDEMNVSEYTWAEAKEALDDYGVEGAFERITGTGLKMWIPDYMYRQGLDDLDLYDGQLALWYDEAGERYISVSCTDTEAADLEEYAKELEEDYDIPSEIGILNGRETLIYTDEDEDCGVTCTLDEGGKLITIQFGPLEDAEFAAVAECLAISVMPYARDRILPNVSEKDEDLFEMNWTDIQDQVKDLGVTGREVTFEEAAVKIWIPDGYESAEIAPEDAAEGLIAAYMDKDEASGFKVEYVDAEGKDLETFIKELEKDKKYTDIEKTLINGNTGVIYNEEAEDSSSLVFETEKGCFFRLTMMPVSDEDFQMTAILAFASVMTADDRVMDTLPAEADPYALTWQEALDYIEENEIEGGFFKPEGIDISLWIPDVMKAQKEDKTWEKDGIIAKFADESGNNFTFTYKDAEGKHLFGEFQEEISKDFDEGSFDTMLINGLAALSYSVDGTTGHIAFETEAGYILDMSFENINDADLLTNAQIIIYSALPGDYEGGSEDSDVHKITVVRGEDLFEDCPKEAKAGEKVQIKTLDVTDGEIVIKVTGTDSGKFVEYALYEFIMPDEDVEISASVSTAGYPGA